MLERRGEVGFKSVPKLNRATLAFGKDAHAHAHTHAHTATQAHTHSG